MTAEHVLLACILAQGVLFLWRERLIARNRQLHAERVALEVRLRDQWAIQALDLAGRLDAHQRGAITRRGRA